MFFRQPAGDPGDSVAPEDADDNQLLPGQPGAGRPVRGHRLRHPQYAAIYTASLDAGKGEYANNHQFIKLVLVLGRVNQHARAHGTVWTLVG